MKKNLEWIPNTIQGQISAQISPLINKKIVTGGSIPKKKFKIQAGLPGD